MLVSVYQKKSKINSKSYVTHPESELQKRNKEEIFSLRMPDDAMIDAGINDNDLILANPLTTPFDGALVVVLVDKHLTVRRYFNIGKSICLAPDNVNYPAIEVIDQTELSIYGVIVKVVSSALKRDEYLS